MKYLFKVPETKHGGVGLYQCKDGYVLKGANTTECKFGNWTRTTPRCVEVYCKFPGTIENGKVNTYSYTSDSNSSNKYSGTLGTIYFTFLSLYCLTGIAGWKHGFVRL